MSTTTYSEPTPLHPGGPMSDPTPTELMLRLDALTQQVSSLVREVRDDRIAMQATYVRKDVYDAQKATWEADIRRLDAERATLESDVAKNKTDATVSIAAERKERISASRWGIGIGLTALGTIVTAIGVFVSYLPSLVHR